MLKVKYGWFFGKNVQVEPLLLQILDSKVDHC